MNLTQLIVLFLEGNGEGEDEDPFCWQSEELLSWAQGIWLFSADSEVICDP